MPNKIPVLEFNKFYHIYNRGTNGCKIFKESINYKYFLKLYKKYIPLVADTFAWVLMSNHLHLLIQIKDEQEILKLQSEQNLKKLDGITRIYQQFSNLFNAYTKSYNKIYNRTGSLFEHPFKRKEVKNENYLKHLVYYIHHNPVHHEFVNELTEYQWSSFSTIISSNETEFKRDEVIDWFDDKKNFIFYHKQQHDLDLLRTIQID